MDASLTYLAKVSGNLNFVINGKCRKAKNIRRYTPKKQMKGCSRLGLDYRYKRIIAQHPVLGEVLLILSARYDKKHQKWRRILLITNDLTLSAPRAIVFYSRRWRVEVFFKSMKQQLRMGVFQLRRFSSIRSHFYLRGLAYLLLSVVRRNFFLQTRYWSLRKVKRWFYEKLTMLKVA
jgi:transposase